MEVYHSTEAGIAHNALLKYNALEQEAAHKVKEYFNDIANGREPTPDDVKDERKEAIPDLKNKNWTDWEIVGFAGYYHGRITSNPKVQFTEVLKEFKEFQHHQEVTTTKTIK